MFNYQPEEDEDSVEYLVGKSILYIFASDNQFNRKRYEATDREKRYSLLSRNAWAGINLSQ